MTEFDKALEEILGSPADSASGQSISWPADPAKVLAIKQAINVYILPVQREIKRVKQAGYGTGWPLPESSATHYSMGFNRAIDKASTNLWGEIDKNTGELK